MDQIIAWLQQHKISTHTIAVLWMGLLLYYQSNADFHALVTGAYARLPKWVSTIALAAFSLYSWYRNGQRTPANGNGSGPGILSAFPQAGGSQAGIRPGSGGGLKAAMVAVLCLAIIPFASGCRRNINTNPQVVFANTLLEAANSTKLLSDGLAAANEYAESIEQSDPNAYAGVHAWILKIRDANDKAIAATRAAEAGDTSADWRGAMLGILTAAGNQDPAAFGFKNPQSASDAKIGLNALVLAISAISGSFGGH